MPFSHSWEGIEMIADALRTEIERYAARRRQNPLFALAEEGRLTRATVARYIANVHYVIQYTPVYLTRARDAAAKRGDAQLAAHYQAKLGEEVGHDAWSEKDLESFTRLSAQSPNTDVTRAMIDLVEFLARIIDEDPTLYLAYIAYAEYLVVLLGDEWLALLDERCGISRTSMTVIDNHVELDRDHADDAFAKIDALVGEPRKLPRMRQVLLETLERFDAFCVELTKDDREVPLRADASAA
jgi:pyrroloquinoline quinone (PQQ) biosynthesis protein C